MCNCCDDCKNYRFKYKKLLLNLKKIKKQFLLVKKWINKKN